MPELPSPTSAFSKLKGLFMKLIPLIGGVIGFFISGIITKPVSAGVDRLFSKFGFKRQAERGFFNTTDFQQLMIQIPAALIVAGIIAAAAMLLKGLIDNEVVGIIGNFMLGLAVGILIGNLYGPFQEDVFPLIPGFPGGT